MKNVTVEIAGAAYPLCMTVAAMEQICEKFGSLPNLLEAVRAEDPAKAPIHSQLFKTFFL